MTSLHFWGEGVSSQNHGSLWKLVVRNSGDETATLEGWQLRFYGTYQQPQTGNFFIPSQVNLCSTLLNWYKTNILSNIKHSNQQLIYMRFISELVQFVVLAI